MPFAKIQTVPDFALHCHAKQIELVQLIYFTTPLRIATTKESSNLQCPLARWKWLFGPQRSYVAVRGIEKPRHEPVQRHFMAGVVCIESIWMYESVLQRSP